MTEESIVIEAEVETVVEDIPLQTEPITDN